MFIVDFFPIFITTVPYCDLTSELTLFWTSLSFQIMSDIKSIWFFQQQRVAFFCFIYPFWFSSSQHRSRKSKVSLKNWTDLRTSPHSFANTHAAESELEIISIFVNPKWKWKQTNTHKLMGNGCSQTSISRNWKETRKHEKTLSFKEVF